MKSKILKIIFIMLLFLGVTGCYGEVTMDEIKKVNEKINNYFSNAGYKYDNFSFNYIDEENMQVVVGLIDNSELEQKRFKELVIDSDVIKFIQGDSNLPRKDKRIEIIKRGNDNNKYKKYLERDNQVIYLASNIEEVYYMNNKIKYSLKDYITSTWQATSDSIKKLTELMKREEILRDGGTTIYKSEKYDITVITCNTISGNRDVYIGSYVMSFNSEVMCK